MAGTLKSYITKNSLSVKIVDKDYVLVEGWQFAGSLMGLYPRIVKVENIAPNKWMAQAEIISRKTNEVVSTGYAICSKEEFKKKTFDEYAILSMAQTRAIGKAFRNLIGWVIKFAGYEGTPSEEMTGKTIPTQTPSVDQSTIEIKGVAGSLMAGEKEIEKIKALAKGLNLNTPSQIAKKIGIKVDFGSMTKTMAVRVLTELMNLKVK